ncbi:MAG: hypothetical protein IPM21_14150 [Acidobacteria bacterium]|nr:hypothetical protein [Acidobacteriota bacterium]
MGSYDIPDELSVKALSGAFKKFYYNWFVNSFGLTRGEVDLEFLADLTTQERELAIGLLRRNLGLGHSHLVEGIGLLDDKESIPTLRTMLAETTDASRRLTIAGSLWKLCKDESFPKEIERMVKKGNRFVKEAHLEQILWLGDTRSIRYLIDLVAEGDTFAGSLALSRLNEIEDNKRYLLGRDEFPHQPDYYLRLRDDDYFLTTMLNKMINYSPATAIMTTVSGIVITEI